MHRHSRFKPIVIPLAGSLDESVSSVAGEPMAYTSLSNMYFDKKATLTTRPGQVRTTGFTTRTLNAAGAPVDAATTQTAAAKGLVPQAMLALRDARGDHPAYQSYGHLYTYESDKWVDKLGAASVTTKRLVDYQQLTTPYTLTSVPAVADNFGVTDLPAGGSAVALLTTPGAVKVANAISSFTAGMGTSARCGSTTATVSVASGSNELKLVRRIGDTVTSSSAFAVDARTPVGRGDSPVICCDFNQTVFFVAYFTTTNHQVKVLRVDPATGNILTTTSFVKAGAGTVRGLWLTNTNTADNRVIVGSTESLAGNGIDVAVLNATTLANVFANGNIIVQANPYRQIVVGAAANNTVWFVAKQDNSGQLQLWNYNYTTGVMGGGAGVETWRFFGADYGTAPGALNNGAEFNILHQPIVVMGRTILGLSVIHGTTVQNDANSTWYELDITDTWQLGTTVGVKKIGALLARGPLMGGAPVWNPVAATVFNQSTWRFPTYEWRQFKSGPANSAMDQLGTEAAYGINQCSFNAPQASVAGEASIISGAVPHVMTRGYVYENGFPFLDSPPMMVTKTAAGTTLVAASWTIQACWRWTDEAGQVHRSAPSVPFTITIANGDRIDIVGPILQVTEREFGKVWLEVYSSGPSPAAGAPMLLYATLDATPTGSAGTVTVSIAVIPSIAPSFPLYTNGNVLANRFVQGDGGVALVGRRCWLSDGEACYGSKLINFGEAPAWCDDGSLTVRLPASAGQVVSLQEMDSKLVILCEQGVFITGGDGPDDAGVGQDFADAIRVGQVGCAGTRSSAKSPKGIFFQAKVGNPGDTQVEGLWLLDRGHTTTQVSARIKEAFTPGDVSELFYWPELDHLFVLMAAGDDLFIWDVTADRWASWTADTDGFGSGAFVGAVPWFTGLSEPSMFTTQATNDTTTGSEAIAWQFFTSDLLANQQDPLGWARVQLIRLMGESVSNQITITAFLDQGRNFTTTWTPLNGVPSGSNWPSTTFSPEFRCTTQKCSSIKVEASGTGLVNLTHVKLMVMPLNNNAPAANRK